MKNKNYLNQNGFTLIELLIVIAILGILAAVLLVIINPAKQRQRAQDGVLLRTINNIAGSIESFHIVRNRYPFNDPGCTGSGSNICELYSEIENETHLGTQASGRYIWFQINGVNTGDQNRIYYTDTYTNNKNTPNANYSYCLVTRANEDITPSVNDWYVWRGGDAGGKGVQLCNKNHVGVIAACKEYSDGNCTPVD